MSGSELFRTYPQTSIHCNGRKRGIVLENIVNKTLQKKAKESTVACFAVTVLRQKKAAEDEEEKICSKHKPKSIIENQNA